MGYKPNARAICFGLWDGSRDGRQIGLKTLGVSDITLHVYTNVVYIGSMLTMFAIALPFAQPLVSCIFCICVALSPTIFTYF